MIKKILNTLGVITLVAAIIVAILWWIKDQPKYEPIVTTFTGIAALISLFTGWMIPKSRSEDVQKRTQARDVEIREDILNKLSDYHKAGRQVKISQVINWFKSRYSREQTLQELERMEQDKLIVFDGEIIGRATEIRLLKNDY